MPFPNIWIVCDDLTSGNAHDQANKRAAFQDAVNLPSVYGSLVPAPAADTDFGLFSTAVAMSTKPFVVRMPTLPLPAGWPSFDLNGVQVGKFWDADYLPAWQDYVTALVSQIEGLGLLGSLDGLRFSPVTPYAFDDEFGLEGVAPGSKTRNDAIFAAAGYTPVGYLNATFGAAAFLDGLPELAGKTLTVCIFTPGDQPRVDNSGNVLPNGGDGTFAPQIVAEIVDGYTIGPVVHVWSTFEGAPPDAMQVALASATGNPLSVQLQTGMTQDQVTAAFAAIAAMNPPPQRVEVHVSEAPFIAAALAALGE